MGYWKKKGKVTVYFVDYNTNAQGIKRQKTLLVPIPCDDHGAMTSDLFHKAIPNEIKKLYGENVHITSVWDRTSE